jgi:hypothetical protein
MGERLAKEVEAILRAKVEQSPIWKKGPQQGGFTPKDATMVLGDMYEALREVVVYLASEVDDPPRTDKPEAEPPVVLDYGLSEPPAPGPHGPAALGHAPKAGEIAPGWASACHACANSTCLEDISVRKITQEVPASVHHSGRPETQQHPSSP